MKIHFLFAWILILLTGLVGNALAHKVVVFSWVEANAVHVQAGFGSDRPAINAQVTVKTPGGKVVFQGVTSDKGLCSFPLSRPADSELIVEVDAGTGHRGQWTLSREEIRQALETSPAYLDETQARRDELNKGPSLLKILLGIGIIFLLALGVKKIRTRTQ